MTTGRSRILSGIISTTRPDQEDGDKILGCFLNSVPFNFTVSGYATGLEYIQAVNDTYNKVIAHSKLSLVEIVGMVGEKTEDQRNTLFNSTFSYVDFYVFNESHKKTETTRPIVENFEAIDTSFDLIVSNHVELVVSILYNATLYDIDEIRRISEYLEAIVADIAARAADRIDPTTWISEKEREKLIKVLNKPAIRHDRKGEILPSSRDTAGYQSVVELIWEQSTANGRRVAISFGAKEISYSELISRAETIAAFLRQKCKPSATIAVMMRRSDNMVISLLAITRAGMSFVPLDPAWPAERLAVASARIQADLVVTDADLTPAVKGFHTGPVLTPPDLPVANDDSLPAIPYPDRSQVMYTLFTSGSTGVPKGVRITHANFSNYIRWANLYYFKSERGYDMPFFTPLTFDLTLTCIFSTLCRGDKLEIMPDVELTDTLHSIFEQSSRVNAVKITPSHISVLQSVGLTTTPVGLVIIGGEALHREQVDTLRSLNPDIEVFNEYGPTETTVGCTVSEIGHREEFINIGKPIHNLRIYILGEERELLPEGVPGQIYIGGDGLGEYVDGRDNKDRFLEPFSPCNERVYRSGDLGRWHQGNLQYLGRTDRQVKLRGFRIELDEIESHLMMSGYVNNCCVTVEGDNLICYLPEGNLTQVKDIDADLRERVPVYMIPTNYLFVSEFPLNRNGKVDLKRLREKVSDKVSLERTFVGPVNEMERTISEVWKKLLQKNQVSTSDNFFELGGHSVRAMQFAAAMRKRGIGVALTDLYSNPVLKNLSDFLLIKSGQGHHPDEIQRASAKNKYKTSHSQRMLWTFNQAASDRSMYNIPLVYKINSPVDVTCFGNAIQIMLQRHEALRTVFSFSEEGLFQIVLPYAEDLSPLRYEDFSSQKEALVKALQSVQKIETYQFDLEKAPLAIFYLAKVSDKEYVFCINVHHIVFDEWSGEIFFSELLKAYESGLYSRAVVLPAIAAQYKDFAEWKNNAARLDADEKFWKQMFDRPIEPLSLPFDKEQVEGDKIRSDVYVTEVRTDFAKRLSALDTRGKAVTTFVVFLSAFKILLLQYTRKTDICIGVPFSGRTSEDINHTIGFFLNILPVRSQIDPNETFWDFMLRVNDIFTRCLAHSEYPFELIQENLAQSELYQVGFTWHEFAISEQEAPASNLRFEQVRSVQHISKRGIWLHGYEKNGAVSLSMDYYSNLYSRERIELMMSKFKRILDIVSKDFRIKISDLEPQLEQGSALRNEIVLDF
ncbi:amino acid adenylation domain-containing protein [Tolypothrix sp. VBCCA 56010]|uniref:amino acid adenylation domain-containing protein n=1 Tax=Tolypothrix sp. VBCCA 56010 TaxID=3137731 RepID=UPI003D7E4073